MIIKKIKNIFLLSLLSLSIIFMNISNSSFAQGKVLGWADGYANMPAELGHLTS